jgi:hypothetical protein
LTEGVAINSFYVRSFAILAIGLVCCGLLVWGFVGRNSKAQRNHPEPTPNVALLPVATPTPMADRPSESPSPEVVAVVTPQASATPVVQQSQQTGTLPLGVSPNAVNPEVYKKLPGVQPPLINHDGRDMGPEALNMLKTRREPVPMPGLSDQNRKAMPFPKTVEEAQGQVQATASPSP